ncbi:MAG: DUF932 domain-containing protein [Chloroflexi bacterium]|jgi:hypothetical protein|nr:DUF932 domain-containing protein [Chloroflexota bacterium]
MEEIELLEETSNWRSRKVEYIAGNLNQITKHIPSFELQDFFLKEDAEINNNPYYKTVIRLPLTPVEKRIPIGIVSNTYTLAQHRKVVDLCIEGIKGCGIDIDHVRCELGLSIFGEWMNFRIYFPDKYDFSPSGGDPLKLRLECFNSVDGSSRLIILFGWFRFICSNGMVIGETISELRDIHNRHMDLSKVKSLIIKAMHQVHSDKEKMSGWKNIQVDTDSLAHWVDTSVSRKWGKIPAFRAFHICTSGHDAKYADPFEPEKPSRKSMIELGVVPGAPNRARNLYDVGQALSWIATNRNNAEEKTRWQSEIPGLLEDFAPAVA